MTTAPRNLVDTLYSKDKLLHKNTSWRGVSKYHAHTSRVMLTEQDLILLILPPGIKFASTDF